MKQCHVYVDVFHELMVRRCWVFVSHSLATQKSFKVKRFGRNTEKGSPFSVLCRNISPKGNKDETVYEWSLTDMEEGLLLFGC